MTELIAARIAFWSGSSSSVGELWQYLVPYHNTFEIAIEKNAISERKDNVRTGLCGNSDQNFAGLSFCGFLLLYQRAEQLGNATQIDICHLVSSLSWICFDNRNMGPNQGV